MSHSRPSMVVPRLTRRRAERLFAPHRPEPLADDAGAATAEYAIVVMAAVAFAGVLVALVRSDQVRGILEDLLRRALSVS